MTKYPRLEGFRSRSPPPQYGFPWQHFHRIIFISAWAFPLWDPPCVSVPKNYVTLTASGIECIQHGHHSLRTFSHLISTTVLKWWFYYNPQSTDEHSEALRDLVTGPRWHTSKLDPRRGSPKPVILTTSLNCLPRRHKAEQLLPVEV